MSVTFVCAVSPGRTQYSITDRATKYSPCFECVAHRALEPQRSHAAQQPVNSRANCSTIDNIADRATIAPERRLNLYECSALPRQLDQGDRRGFACGSSTAVCSVDGGSGSVVERGVSPSRGTNMHSCFATIRSCRRRSYAPGPTSRSALGEPVASIAHGGVCEGESSMASAAELPLLGKSASSSDQPMDCATRNTSV